MCCVEKEVKQKLNYGIDTNTFFSIDLRNYFCVKGLVKVRDRKL